MFSESLLCAVYSDREYELSPHTAPIHSAWLRERVLSEQVEFKLRPKEFKDARHAEVCVHQASGTAHAKVLRQKNMRIEEQKGLRNGDSEGGAQALPLTI